MLKSILKGSLFTLIIFSLVNLFAYNQQPVSLGNLDMAFASQPNKKGSRSNGLMRFYYSDKRSISSGFSFIYETRKEDSDFLDRKNSLLLNESKDFTLDLYLLEYTFYPSSILKFRLGAAFNVTTAESEEKGYFVTSPDDPFHPEVPVTATENQVFKNTMDTTFLAPKVQLDIVFVSLQPNGNFYRLN